MKLFSIGVTFHYVIWDGSLCKNVITKLKSFGQLKKLFVPLPL